VGILAIRAGFVESVKVPQYPVDVMLETIDVDRETIDVDTFEPSFIDTEQPTLYTE